MKKYSYTIIFAGLGLLIGLALKIFGFVVLLNPLATIVVVFLYGLFSVTSDFLQHLLFVVTSTFVYLIFGQMIDAYRHSKNLLPFKVIIIMIVLSFLAGILLVKVGPSILGA